MVYFYFSKWKNTGVIEQIHELFRDKVHTQAGKKKSPNLFCIDNQFIKTTHLSGIDRCKKIEGRKHHIVTDTMGLLVAVIVRAAQAILPLYPKDGLSKERLPGLKITEDFTKTSGF